MKNSSKRFTLIELLVVIAIIAILAGLMFPAIGTVRNNARKSKAGTECQALKSAIIMYESEFSCWPIKSGSGGSDAAVSDYKGFCDAITGKNAKNMVFYEVGMADTDGRILDPWGREYKIVLDLNYDGKIENTEISSINSAMGKSNTVRSSVAVYSYGVNKNESLDINKLASERQIVTSW